MSISPAPCTAVTAQAWFLLIAAAAGVRRATSALRTMAAAVLKEQGPLRQNAAAGASWLVTWTLLALVQEQSTGPSF